MYAELLDSQKNRKAILNNCYRLDKTTKLNGLFELNIQCDLEEYKEIAYTDLIKLDNQIYIISDLDSLHTSNKIAYSLKCEHISYKLSEKKYENGYANTGTALQILTDVLKDTEFALGNVIADTENIVLSTNVSTNAFQVMLGISKYCNAILYFTNNGYTINFTSEINNNYRAIFGKNLNGINKRITTESIGYDVDLTQYKDETFELLEIGETVAIKDTEQGLDTTLQVVELVKDYITNKNTRIVLGSSPKNLTDKIIEIDGTAVKQGKLYHGIKITNENGLEIKRSDGYAESILNSDTFAMRSLVEGTMKDAIYFDTIKRKYVIDGTVEVQGSLSSDANFTDSLYAEQGDIAQLTVDWIDTSKRIVKYLKKDLSDNDYFEGHENCIEFITASVKYGTDTSTPLTEHLQNRYDDLLYWSKDISNARVVNGYPFINDEQVYTQTAETDYPVIVYQYTKLTKLSILFEEDINGILTPKITLGAGAGNAQHEEWGKAFIYKGIDGLNIDYYSLTGELRKILLGDNGIVLTPYDLEKIDFYSNGFSTKYSSETVSYSWIKNTNGEITALVTDDNVTIPINWNGGTI